MKPVDSRTMLVHFPANLKVGCPETVSAGINIVRDPDGARSRDPNRKVFFAGRKERLKLISNSSHPLALLQLLAGSLRRVLYFHFLLLYSF